MSQSKESEVLTAFVEAQKLTNERFTEVLAHRDVMTETTYSFDAIGLLLIEEVFVESR